MNYFVDKLTGNDGNSGTEAYPWRSINKVNSQMPYFQWGDTIFFKRGSVWSQVDNQSLNIRCSGSAMAEVIFGAYGDGPKPLFSGWSTDTPIYIQSANLAYIGVQDLAIKNVTGVGNFGVGFTADGCRQVRLSGLDIDNIGHSGLCVMCADGYLLEDCIISNCGLGGIAVIGERNYHAKNGIIRRNKVSNMPGSDGITLHDGGMTGEILGANHLLEGNVCSNCGEQGFDITSGNSIILLANESFGNKISGIITSWWVSDILIDRHYSHDEGTAIYLATTDNIKIIRSILKNWSRNIRCDENVNNLEIYDNLLFITAAGGSCFYESTPNYDIGMGRIIQHNSFSGENVDFKFITYWQRNPTSTNSNFDYNRYWHPDGDPYISRWLGQGFAGWKATYNQDANSIFSEEGMPITHSISLTLNVEELNDFTLTGTPTSQTVQRGQQTTFKISAAALGIFNKPITISIAGLPVGVSTNLSANPINPGQEATLTIITQSSVVLGSYTFTVTGTSQ